MRLQKREAKDSIFDISHEDILPAETAAAEIDVSNSMMVDAAENNIPFQSEYEVQTIEEAEKENNATLVGCNKVDKSKLDGAEEEYMYEEHAAEEVEMGLGEAKEGEEGEEGKEEEERDDYDDDNGDDVDVDVDDDEDGNDDDFGEDDDYDDYDDEKDDMMEEEEIDENTKLENNDNTVEESEYSQRNTVEEGKKEENAKEENEEREGGSLKTKVKTLGKGRERKKVTTDVSDKVASKSKDKQEEDGQGDAMQEAYQENAKDEIQEKGGSSKQKVKKLGRRRRRQVAAGGFEKVASKQDDKVESSHRKKSSKKVESMGMIFMCSSKTKKDCYRYKVLGLPANKRDVVGKIYKGMRLFLYDVDLKLMYGIYKAAGPGGYNIQPRAFNSQFPSQVRFTVLEDCLPLAEEKFKKVIKDNYFTKTKFDCRLTSQQVKNLCKLFVSASKGSKSVRMARRVKTHASTNQDRSRAQGEERRSAMDDRRRYHVYSRKREREMVASPVAPVPQLLLPPAAATTSYAYDRTLELDAYERDLVVELLDSHRQPVPEPRVAYRTAPFIEHRDVYRRGLLLHQLDSYRRDVDAEHLDLRLLDEIGRRDPCISYREGAEHRDLRSRDDFGRHDPYFSYRGSSEDQNLRSPDEIGRRDRYISYRERPAYRDHVYGTGPLPEHDHYRPISRSTEYRSAVAPLPEYRSARPLHRY